MKMSVIARMVLLIAISTALLGIVRIRKSLQRVSSESTNDQITIVVSPEESVDQLWTEMKRQSQAAELLTIRNEDSKHESTLIHGIAEERVVFGPSGCPLLFHVCSNGVFFSRGVIIGEAGYGAIPIRGERLNESSLRSLCSISTATNDVIIPMETNNTVQIVLHSGARVSSLFDVLSCLEKQGSFFPFVVFVPHPGTVEDSLTP